jgi:hypothetical protein
MRRERKLTQGGTQNLHILKNFTLYLQYGWSVNLRVIESCVCSIRCIERKMGSILRTVYEIGSAMHSVNG